MIISCRATAPAQDGRVVAEVWDVLERRAAMTNPPVTVAVSDAVALGIAGLMKSPTPAGQVLDRFYRHGSVDSDELIEAARTEQGYAPPEGHAALYCLVGWVQARLFRAQEQAARS